MKGYKATYNGKCLEQLYEVGKTYKITGNLKICENGFHFCKEIDDVLGYYDPGQDLVIFEVEALGEIITKGNKSVTDEIKIVREIPVSEWNDLFTRHKFDERKNRIYKKYLNGEEWHWKYDENNNLIYQKDYDGEEYHWKYDENNNCIYKKFPSGNEWHYKYDERNNRIYGKNSYGYEYHYKYDKNNNLI